MGENGILNQAKNAAEKTKQAEADEYAKFDEIGRTIKKYTNEKCSHENTELQNQTDTYSGDLICLDCGEIVDVGHNYSTSEIVANSTTGKPAPEYFYYGDYKYTKSGSNDYWTVNINTFYTGNYLTVDSQVEKTDKNQTSYGEIIEKAYDIPVENMYRTFTGCTLLKTTPVIPSSVKNLEAAFAGCTSLETATAIPSSVVNMQHAFQNCTSLVETPDMSNATGVEGMACAFAGCTSLVRISDMSNANNVKNMYQTFQNCTSLNVAPVIPKGVTNMNSTFLNCSSLAATISIPCHIDVSSYLSCPATVEKYHYEGCGH